MKCLKKITLTLCFEKEKKQRIITDNWKLVKCESKQITHLLHRSILSLSYVISLLPCRRLIKHPFLTVSYPRDFHWLVNRQTLRGETITLTSCLSCSRKRYRDPRRNYIFFVYIILCVLYLKWNNSK